MPLLVAVGLLVYTAIRAAVLSITHDEGSSYLIWTNFSIFKCAWSSDCWSTANLHWFYVLLMKGSIQLFGTAEWALRLPSLLAHVVYLFFSWKLLSSWTAKPWVVTAGFIVLNFNPYLLDFFSLARGYGLSVTCMLVSIYYLSRHQQTGKTVAIAGAFIAAFLAVLSNFTQLVYFACMVGVLGLLALSDIFTEGKTAFKKWLPTSSIAVATSLVLFLLLRKPIEFLNQKGEFEYGAGSFLDTFTTVVKSSLYGKKVFHAFNVEYLGGGLVLLLTVFLAWSVRAFLKAPSEARNRFFLLASLLPVLTALATIVQHYLVGSQYLVGRTALLFIPLCALPVSLLFVLFSEKKSTWVKMGIPVLVAGFCVVQFFRAAQFRLCGEWVYDFRTKDMMHYLREKIPEGQKIKLGTSWQFNPAATYYKRTMPNPVTDTLIFSHELRIDTFYDYYYVSPGDAEKLKPLYEEVERFDWVGSLMKRVE